MILPQEASYHIEHMSRRNSRVIAGIIAITVSCTPRVSVPPPVGPITPPIPSAEQSGVISHRFIPNTYRYRFQQTADIRGNGPADTIPSRITTRGIFVVHVTSELDSLISVAISADSISITSEGSIPGRGLQQISALDSVIAARFSQGEVVVESRLPDSLCAYSHVTSMARELLLPELGIQADSPTKRVYRDTVTQDVCRAGTNIQLITVRDLRDRGRNPVEFTLEQQSRLQGAGLLRRDSITVAGSINTQGSAFFTAGNRLPFLIQSQSEGRITVRLGTTTTLFHQESIQELRLEPGGLP